MESRNQFRMEDGELRITRHPGYLTRWHWTAFKNGRYYYGYSVTRAGSKLRGSLQLLFV